MVATVTVEKCARRSGGVGYPVPGSHLPERPHHPHPRQEPLPAHRRGTTVCHLLHRSPSPAAASAADQLPAPLMLRNALRIIDIHTTQTIDRLVSCQRQAENSRHRQSSLMSPAHRKRLRLTSLRLHVLANAS